MNLTAKLILVLFGLAYLISPVDIIPDLVLPVLGWIDDGLVLWSIFHLIRNGDLPWFLFKRPGTPGPSRHSAGNPHGNRNGQAAGQHKATRGPDTSPGDQGDRNSPPSPYDILGVDPAASWEEIQTAYREKIKQYHPDKLSHLGEDFSSLANEKFLEIQAAFDQLKARQGRP